MARHTLNATRPRKLRLFACMKFALTFLAASLLVTACQPAELSHQCSSETEINRTDFGGTVAGHQPIDPKTSQHFLGTPTTAEKAADKEILQHIVGTWTTLENPRWAPYHVLSIQPDGSFTAIKTNRTKLICEGIWFVERGFLLLVKHNASPFVYFGFHKIDHVDDQELVCDIDMSVAGRLRFAK